MKKSAESMAKEEKERILQEFRGMQDRLGKLQKVVLPWEQDVDFNLHLLRSDQMVGDRWSDFRKVFLFPLFPQSAFEIPTALMKKSGEYSSYTKLIKQKHFDHVMDEFQTSGGARAVELLLASPHIHEVVDYKKHLVDIMHPSKATHDDLGRFGAKPRDIQWVQDAFFRWLMFCNYLVNNDLLRYPSGKRSRQEMAKENPNLADVARKLKKTFVSRQNKLMAADAPLFSDPGNIQKELEGTSTAIRELGAVQELSQLTHPTSIKGRPIDEKMYAFFASLYLSAPDGKLPPWEKGILSLVDQIFPKEGPADDNPSTTRSRYLLASFDRYRKGKDGRSILDQLKLL